MSLAHQDPLARHRLIQFGRNIQRARQIAGVSQQRLADLSGVSQSVISRLERGLAPRLGLERLLQLHQVLGNALPLGACPHDHACVWQPLTETGQRSHTEALATGISYWDRTFTLRHGYPRGREPARPTDDSLLSRLDRAEEEPAARLADVVPTPKRPRPPLTIR